MIGLASRKIKVFSVLVLAGFLVLVGGEAECLDVKDGVYTLTVSPGIPSVHMSTATINDGRRGIAPGDVEEIIVQVTERNALQNSERGTSSIMAAQYSIPFCASLALCRDIEDPSNFNEEMLVDPAVNSLIDKVKVVGNPAIKTMNESVVDVVLSNGARHQKEVFHPKGHPLNPLSYEEISNKFLKLTKLIVPKDRARQIVETVAELESMEDINELADLLGE